MRIDDPFTDEEAERYARQLVLRGFGARAQLELRAGHVVVAGLGALGGLVAQYLAAAGVGRLTFHDDDVVSLSNLQRQTLYTTQDVGALKVERARTRIAAVNPLVEIETQSSRLTREADLARTVLVLIDATDNFSSRYELNRLSRAHGIALVSGAVGGWQGQVSVFNAAQGEPCYRCFVPEIPPNADGCEIGGVMGPVCGVIASVMATEAIKLLSGAGEALQGRLFLYDGRSGDSRCVVLQADPDCPECGRGQDA
jgi:molybdopterin-synthase adenylyltransferase